MVSTFAATGASGVRTLSSTNRNMGATVQWFFDRQKLLLYMERRHLIAMNRIGGWMRRYMQQSMRASTAGEPHSVPGKGRYSAPKWSTKLLRGSRSGGGPGIFYSYDKQIRGVVVGPVRISTNPAVRPSGKTVPQLLNEGGTASRTMPLKMIKKRGSKRLINPYSKGGKIIARRIRKKTKSGGQYHYFTLQPGTSRFPARPFAQPALQAAIREKKLKWAYDSLR